MRLQQAARDVFPAATALEPMAGGMSGANVFRFEAEGQRWVIREGEARAAECARMASELGVGPRVRFVDGPIVIMEHIEGTPFAGVRDREVIARAAAAFRAIHRGPPFPSGASVDGFFDRVNALGVGRFGQAFPPDLVAIWQECVARTALYPRTPCHHDPNPGNVLVTKDRVVFVDWDSACEGDPFFDLALLGVFGAPSPADRDFLVHAYLERAPTADELAHARIARTHAFAFYSVAFRYVCALTNTVPTAEPVPLAELGAHLGNPAVAAASLLEAAKKSATRTRPET
jgi:aminoglycoside phosphotransferase (APT) family kinase protein